MKKLFLLLPVLALLFVACETTEKDPNVLKFSVNGVEKDFSENVTLATDIFGQTVIKSTVGNEILELTIQSAAIGVYEKNQDEIVLLDHEVKFVSEGKDYTSYWNNGGDYDISVDVADVANNVVNEIKGTFTATAMYWDVENHFAVDGTDSTLMITAGEFYYSAE